MAAEVVAGEASPLQPIVALTNAKRSSTWMCDLDKLISRGAQKRTVRGTINFAVLILLFLAHSEKPWGEAYLSQNIRYWTVGISAWAIQADSALSHMATNTSLLHLKVQSDVEEYKEILSGTL